MVLHLSCLIGQFLRCVVLIVFGTSSGPGAATGVVVFDSLRAAERAAQGVPVILVREETSPEDIGGLNAAQGVLVCACVC